MPNKPARSMCIYIYRTDCQALIWTLPCSVALHFETSVSNYNRLGAVFLKFRLLKDQVKYKMIILEKNM